MLSGQLQKWLESIYENWILLAKPIHHFFDFLVALAPLFSDLQPLELTIKEM